MTLDFQGKEINFTDEGKGKCIVLLHGFTESLKIWKKFDESLNRSFRVITIDLSGKPLQTFIRSNDYGFLVVPVNEYPNGVYIVDFTDGANRHSARFIVVR